MEPDPSPAGLAGGDPAPGGSTPAPATPPGPRLTMFEQARLEEARARAAEVEARVRESAALTAGVRKPRGILTAVAFVAAALAVIGVYRQPEELLSAPRGALATAASAAASLLPGAKPAKSVFGKSGGVLVRFALPGQGVELPLEYAGDRRELRYQWVKVSDSSAADVARAFSGSHLATPHRPGFYRLVLQRGDERRVIDDVTLAVLVPFSHKTGPTLNGYRIGTYVAEKLGTGRAERPVGFVQIDRDVADLHITAHLRLSDFITRDGQTQWPRYAVVSPRLLEKLELVMNEITKLRGGGRVHVAIDVNSGFRTPLHNGRVQGSADDSRHQYGDAADVTIDADGDGRYTSFDARIVAVAVEQVERKNPELVGGLGLYTSPRYRTSYVHIDARGRKARWRG